MINDANQELISWDNSTNMQAEVINISSWMQYMEVKEVALDIFKSNFLTLKNEAVNTAVERANEFTEKLIIGLQNKKMETEWIRDPWFQYSLFEAQKSYAKSWDSDMEAVLIDVLVDRLNYTERNLKQIVLDESIPIIAKLTSAQLDTLTILFLLKYTQNYKVNNPELLKWYLNTNLIPFVDNLSKEHSLYQHLEFTWCWSISLWSKTIEDVFLDNYKCIFFKWFSKEYYLEQTWEPIDKYEGFVVQCFNNSVKYQFSARNNDLLETQITDSGNSNECRNLYNEFVFTKDEVKNKLIEVWWEVISKLFDVWDNSALKNMTITTVWIAIAQANFRRKTWTTLDLSIWIK
ncbi:MAG: hypothetical protein ACD_4C00249G0003 [uncultured bacterium (gcode 4)]|uniref:Uncharacterized protein n=1 Tax=uncultured bacterium (gcode 4) TaxID=1234023 RepID=K2FUE0_9BACT|nr:MAG: hypothetical protein ACD_4C00249G0003 [uncultured bacterium (gcode 4)]